MTYSRNPFFTPGKHIAILLDPDKQRKASIRDTLQLAAQAPVDVVFVGGSMLFTSISKTVKEVKQHTRLPVWLFPGSAQQVTAEADGILFLSVISGRNPELLIGNHVIAAPAVRRSKLQVVSVGYMLIEGGATTSVEYMSQTRPIPRDKADIAVATAIAGEMLGLQMIYLEAGSGAEEPVSTHLVKSVRAAVDVPLIVGGGIQEKQRVEALFQAGADWVVLGNHLEQQPDMLRNLASLKKKEF